MDINFDRVYSAENDNLKAVLPLDAVDDTVAMLRVMAACLR